MNIAELVFTLNFGLYLLMAIGFLLIFTGMVKGDKGHIKIGFVSLALTIFFINLLNWINQIQ